MAALTPSRRSLLLPQGMAPRYLSPTETAAYLRVSADTFDHEVSVGQWPTARHRGMMGTCLTWDRPVLDAYAGQAAGIGLQETGTVPVFAPLPPIPVPAALAAPAEGQGDG